MDKYRDFFNEYAAGFDVQQKPIWRKHEHTFRVVDNSKQISASLNLPPLASELAELIGLFHDIGRFEQWRQFQSFNDQTTIDHADLGADIIRESGILDNYIDRDILIIAIINHNKFEIDPKITDDRTLVFCKIIRDADKLDIIRDLVSGAIEIHPTTGSYSESAIHDAMSHRLIDRRLNKDEVNHTLAALAMFNDIYFDYTKQCILNELLIEKLTERFIESNPEQEKTLRRVESTIKMYY